MVGARRRVAGAVALTGLVLAACGQQGSTEAGEGRPGRRGAAGTEASSSAPAPASGDPSDEAGPADVVVQFFRPASCAEAVELYSDAAWATLTHPAPDEQAGASGPEVDSRVAGMTREQATAACESDPESFDIGTGDFDIAADDIEVTSQDGDHATVVYGQSGSGEDGSSSFSYEFDLVREDGRWRIDDFGGDLGFDMDSTGTAG